MENKLSQPVAYVFDHGVMGPGDFSYGTPQMHSTAKDENASPLYSKEYVSTLLDALKSSQAIANEYRDLMCHMDAGGDFYEFQRDKAGKK